jgi:hypothetical protein
MDRDSARAHPSAQPRNGRALPKETEADHACADPDGGPRQHGTLWRSLDSRGRRPQDDTGHRVRGLIGLRGRRLTHSRRGSCCLNIGTVDSTGFRQGALSQDANGSTLAAAPGVSLASRWPHRIPGPLQLGARSHNQGRGEAREGARPGNRMTPSGGTGGRTGREMVSVCRRYARRTS